MSDLSVELLQDAADNLEWMIESISFQKHVDEGVYPIPDSPELTSAKETYRKLCDLLDKEVKF